MTIATAGLLSSAYYGVARLLRVPPARRKKVGAAVFCFHNVVSDVLSGSVGISSLHLPASRFSKIIDWIADTYDVVPLSHLAKRLETGRSTSGLACLTFDDAYVGVLNFGVPTLRRLGLPGTVFVISRAADAPGHMWWDVMAAEGGVTPGQHARYLERDQGDGRLILGGSLTAAGLSPELKTLSWEQLARCQSEGVTIGVHTATHRNLTVLNEAEIRDELVECGDAISSASGIRPDMVAYPYGLCSQAVLKVAREVGLRVGLTLKFGPIKGRPSLLALPRVDVPAGITISRLECWAAGLCGAAELSYRWSQSVLHDFFSSLGARVKGAGG